MPARCQRNINPLMLCFHFPKFRMRLQIPENNHIKILVGNLGVCENSENSENYIHVYTIILFNKDQKEVIS